MQNRLHVPVIWGLRTFIKDIVAYIYVEGASRLGDRELSTFIKYILSYIYVEGASCLDDRELSTFVKDILAYMQKWLHASLTGN